MGGPAAIRSKSARRASISRSIATSRDATLDVFDVPDGIFTHARAQRDDHADAVAVHDQRPVDARCGPKRLPPARNKKPSATLEERIATAYRPRLRTPAD